MGWSREGMKAVRLHPYALLRARCSPFVCPQRAARPGRGCSCHPRLAFFHPKACSRMGERSQALRLRQPDTSQCASDPRQDSRTGWSQSTTHWPTWENASPNQECGRGERGGHTKCTTSCLHCLPGFSEKMTNCKTWWSFSTSPNSHRELVVSRRNYRKEEMNRRASSRTSAVYRLGRRQLANIV